MTVKELGESVLARARIGLLVPATNTVMEPEFHEMAPRGVLIFTARMLHKGRKPEDTFIDLLKKMSEDIPEAALRISCANVDIVAFGCTSGSFLEGEEWNRKVAKQIAEITHIPVVTASSAAVSALEALNMKRIAVATPYPEPVNQRLKEFLTDKGFDVARLGSVPYEFSKFSFVAYRLAKKLVSDDLDGVFISCTDFKTTDILDMLERDINKPVVSSNQATMWACLKSTKIREEIKGFGALFNLL